MTTELALTVTREGGAVVRIGPIGYQHVAEQMIRAFRMMAHNTTGAAGASYEIGLYRPKEGETYLPLVPARADVLLQLMDHPVQGSEAQFPDLWSRLQAQHGYETAVEAWTTACALMDQPDDEEAEVSSAVEYGIHYGQDDQLDTTDGFDRPLQEARLARWKDAHPRARLMQRTVTYGPWTEAPS